MSVLLQNDETVLTKGECEVYYSMDLYEIVFSINAKDEAKRFLFCIWYSLNAKWGGRGIYRIMN